MKFKTDENLHEDIALLLQRHGHDAHTVRDESLQGQSDSRISEVCRTESRVLITLDLDFANIHAYPPSLHAGLIVLRLALQDRKTVHATMERLIPLLDREPLVGHLWIVDHEGRRVRVRGSD